MTPAELSTAFICQLLLILAVCRVAGKMARWIGQPQVVGEMIAGVLLGPSLFGLFFPTAQARMFPKESLELLYLLSQFGVGLYMFLVGLEFRTDLFRSRVRSAASVSFAGMAAPFALGALLTPWLIRVPGLFSVQVKPIEAALFIGASICITAFPMLARIIHERGLAGTALGTLALAAGAIDDAAAWCVLAIVLGSFGGGIMLAVKAIAGGALYAIFTLTIGRKWLARLGELAEKKGCVSLPIIGLTLMLIMLAEWITDSIGIHAVFGGFILGAAMPRGLFAEEIRCKLEPFAVILLLPIFFTYSGLNTRLELVNSPKLLGVALVVLAASCLGKGVACWAAARLCGEDQRTSLAIGTLMNARGLMELIIINIGLQKGIIQPALFSILVLMAIATTLMASPLFQLVYGKHISRQQLAKT